MELSSLVELFKSRRSIRRWKNAPVPEELLAKAVEAAGWSPNSGGRQTYRVYVITAPALIAAIGEAVQEVTDYLASLDCDPADRPAVERWQKNSAFFTGAPALIAVTAGIYESIADKLQARNLDNPRVAGINRNRNLAASRIQTIGAFVDHLLLSFHALGLGAVYMVGPTQAKDAVERILGTGPDEDWVALVPVGYPDEQPAAPPRKPLKDFVTFLR